MKKRKMSWCFIGFNYLLIEMMHKQDAKSGNLMWQNAVYPVCFIQKGPCLSRQLLFRLPCYLIGEREGVKEERVRRKEGGRGETAKAKRFRAFPLSAATVLLSGPLSPTPPRCFPKQSYTKLKWGSQTSVDRGRVPIWHWVIETREKECHWLRHFGWMISLSQHKMTGQ